MLRKHTPQQAGTTLPGRGSSGKAPGTTAVTRTCWPTRRGRTRAACVAWNRWIPPSSSCGSGPASAMISATSAIVSRSTAAGTTARGRWGPSTTGRRAPRRAWTGRRRGSLPGGRRASGWCPANIRRRRDPCRTGARGRGHAVRRRLGLWATSACPSRFGRCTRGHPGVHRHLGRRWDAPPGRETLDRGDVRDPGQANP